MYGARLGVDMINKGKFEFEKVADYEWFPIFWETIVSEHNRLNGYDRVRLCEHTGFAWDPTVVEDQIDRLGQSIRDDTGMYIPRFTEDQSRFYKQMSMYKERETHRVLFAN